MGLFNRKEGEKLPDFRLRPMPKNIWVIDELRQKQSWQIGISGPLIEDVYVPVGICESKEEAEKLIEYYNINKIYNLPIVE